MFPLEDFLESANRLGGSHVFPGFAGKNSRDMEWLAQEALNFPSTIDGQLARQDSIHPCPESK